MQDYEKMYYNLICRILDVQEFLTCMEEKNEIIADTEQMICNIIESDDEIYNSEDNICMVC